MHKNEETSTKRFDCTPSFNIMAKKLSMVKFSILKSFYFDYIQLFYFLFQVINIQRDLSFYYKKTSLFTRHRIKQLGNLSYLLPQYT